MIEIERIRKVKRSPACLYPVDSTGYHFLLAV